jgi:acetyl esterase/lipase
MNRFTRAALLYACLTSPALAQPADTEPSRPTVDENGTITGGSLSVPISDFLSDEAKARLTERLRIAPGPMNDLEGFRKRSDDMAKASLEGWQKIYPSTVTSTVIDGVRTDVVVPNAGIDPQNKKRVLINAHQGGFTTGAKYGGALEAIPLAGRGKVKVIAVDYRMAPEHKFPAATEDMEKVYRDALKTTKPENIGIYGCSAGGTLVAQSIAWFQKKNLPLPGAVGIFCSGTMPNFWYGGDSTSVTPFMNANRVPRVSLVAATRGYFDGVDLNDALVTPGLHADVLAKFPPTLVVTGTRDMAMSNAIITHTKLLQAGVTAELFVQEGLGHGHFFTFPTMPESAAAYDVIWSFFDRHLKR